MLEVLRKRRSIRKFQPIPLKAEEVDTLKEIVLRSPSAHNYKSWEFIFVDDRNLLMCLAEVRGGSSAFLAGASLAIVMLGNEKTQDVWVEDASVASMTAQVAAASMGIGSCWVQIRNRDHAPGVTAEDYVRQVLGIPLPFRVLSIIGMGYPAEEKEEVPLNELRFEKIHLNGF
jgi:nitroreductase